MPSIKQLLSSRLLRSSQGSQSRPIVRLSIAGIAICLIVVILAVSISTGYRQVIEQKVIDMGSHIRITYYDKDYENNPSYDVHPVTKDARLLKELQQNPDIAHIQYAATKCGVLQSNEQVEGIILKGVDATFDWKAFQGNMVAGKPLELSGDTTTKGLLVSKSIADRLQLKVGDKVFGYFWNEGKKFDRAFRVCGIYSTGMPEYDDHFVIGDLRHVQKINGWSSEQVGCMEILIHDYDQLDEVGEYVHQHIGPYLQAHTIRQLFPAIFSWTDLFDTNVMVLLTITLIICMITLISTFFIIILERTPTIGILKTMGMTTADVRGVFVRLGLRLIVVGMLIGNVLGIGICLLQKYLHIIKLDAHSYYVSYVPISFNWIFLAAVNLVLLLICLLVLLIPATFVSKRITPVNAIRFE